MTSVASALMETSQLLPLRRILVIENDKAMQGKLQQLFHPEGYAVETAHGAAEGLELLRNAPPSAVVLDIQMTDASARRLFEETRSVNHSVPIIVLGASCSVMHRILFLELGADDYVVKPFNNRELVARVRAAMRRSEAQYSDIFHFADVPIDLSKMEVRRQGKLVTSTAQEFKVLKFMTRNVERAI